MLYPLNISFKSDAHESFTDVEINHGTWTSASSSAHSILTDPLCFPNTFLNIYMLSYLYI